MVIRVNKRGRGMGAARHIRIRFYSSFRSHCSFDVFDVGWFDCRSSIVIVVAVVRDPCSLYPFMNNSDVTS